MNVSPKINCNKIEERINLSFQNGLLQNVTVDTVFELVRDIKDPEHAFTLEELCVVRKNLIKFQQLSNVENIGNPIDCILIEFEPTIPHCSMAAIIGLTIKVLLDKYIRGYFIVVSILEGSHVNDKILNKQLKDKDRVQAAYENISLREIIDECTERIENIIFNTKNAYDKAV